MKDLSQAVKLKGERFLMFFRGGRVYFSSVFFINIVGSSFNYFRSRETLYLPLFQTNLFTFVPGGNIIFSFSSDTIILVFHPRAS